MCCNAFFRDKGAQSSITSAQYFPLSSTFWLGLGPRDNSLNTILLCKGAMEVKLYVLARIYVKRH